jgi:hypothetical protein
VHLALGYRQREAYQRQRLGLDPSWCRALLRIERAARCGPAFGRAWRAGELSFLQAAAFVPLLHAELPEATVVAWLRWCIGECIGDSSCVSPPKSGYGRFPFQRARSIEALPQAEATARRLRAETELGAHAVVVVNLVKEGTPEQRAADRRYGMSVFGAMAEGGYGPLHVGRAVRIERDTDYDRIVFVYYPGADFFADMVQSEFFQSIYGDKQLEDTQAVITALILDRL